MTFASSLAKGLEEIVLKDPSSGKDVWIECDPSLSPIQNAENYYIKARKARAGLKESRERLTDFEERIARLKKMQEALQACSTDEEVEKSNPGSIITFKNIGYDRRRKRKK